jgi:hypothetical protein
MVGEAALVYAPGAAAMSPVERSAWHPIPLTVPALTLRTLAHGLAPIASPGRAAALSLPVGAPAPVLLLAPAAALAGVSVSALSDLEQRGVHVQLARLIRLADAYGLEVELRARRRPTP